MRFVPTLFLILATAPMAVIPARGGLPDAPAETLPAGAQVTEISVQPEAIKLRGKFQAVQLVAMA